MSAGGVEGPTAADFVLAKPLGNARAMGWLADFPALEAWLDRVKKLPSYEKPHVVKLASCVLRRRRCAVVNAVAPVSSTALGWVDAARGSAREARAAHQRPHYGRRCHARRSPRGRGTPADAERIARRVFGGAHPSCILSAICDSRKPRSARESPNPPDVYSTPHHAIARDNPASKFSASRRRSLSGVRFFGGDAGRPPRVRQLMGAIDSSPTSQTTAPCPSIPRG